jgi:hypothetical protein
MKLPRINTIFTLLDNLGQLVVPSLDPNGRFKVNVSNTSAPFVGSSPPAGPTDGDLWYNNDADWRTLFVYDAGNSLWISTTEVALATGHDSVDGALCRLSNIAVPAVGAGFEMPRDALIQRVAVNASGGNATKTMGILVNGATVNTFALAGGEYTNNQLDILVSAGDEILTGATAPGTAVTGVAMVLYVRWRVPP